MEHLTWIKENWFKIGLLGAAFLVAFSFYQSLVVIPREKMSQERLEQLEIEEAQSTRETMRDYCFGDAEDRWQRTFELNSDPIPGEDTARTWHSAAIRASTEQRLRDDKELCLKQYPL